MTSLAAGGTGPVLALTIARRELRGGLAGFRIFLACLVLGVAAIAGVGSVSEAMIEGLRADGRMLLGGDLEVRLYHRPMTGEQLALAEQRGTVSQEQEMRTMARGLQEGARRRLVELRAVDRAYPLYGEIRLSGELPLAEALAERDGVWGAAVAGNLLHHLDLAVGERVRVGEATFEIRALIEHEPDRASRGFALGPTFMVAGASLAATGLVQPGSLVQYYYRVKLPAGGNPRALRAELDARFPDAGWRLRDSSGAAPGVRRFVERIGLFLTLVGLASLLVGGVGIGNAVKSYLEGKTATIATLKCLGASGRLIFASYLVQVLILAAGGVAIGLLLGAGSTFLVAALLGDSLGWRTVEGIYPAPLAVAAAFGLLTSLAFSLWPIARARGIPAAALFRDLVAPAHGRIGADTWAALAATGLALAALAVLSASDRRLAIWFVAGAVGALLLFRATAWAVMALARRLPRSRRAGLRLAVANLHRPGAPTASVVLSLGLGLTVLVAVALIEDNLARQVRQSIPEDAPGFFFIDIQPDQAEPFEAMVRAGAGVTELRMVPSLRGRLTAINGRPPSELDIPSEIAWVFHGDRGLTWTREPVEGARVVEGGWWPPGYAGPPLVSLDAEVARALGLHPGDRLTVNVLGRPVEAAIANLREIDWSTMTLNFVLVFSPGVLEGAPQTRIATVKAEPAAEDGIERAVTDRFANISAIRVKEVLSAVGDLIGHIALAVRATAGLAVMAGVLVLGGAIVAGQRRRIYDAVVLKVLGATRRDIAAAFLLEYGLLGLVTAVIALMIGSLAAFLVLTEIMELDFAFLPVAALGSAGIALVVTLGFGLAATWRALGRKAAPLPASRRSTRVCAATCCGSTTTCRSASPSPAPWP